MANLLHLPHSLLALGWPGGLEWLLIAGAGLLIFGKRLPEVGRSLGKGIVEFKKGLKGIEDDVDQAAGEESRRELPDKQYKFDPYTGKPLKQDTPSQ